MVGRPHSWGVYDMCESNAADVLSDSLLIQEEVTLHVKVCNLLTQAVKIRDRFRGGGCCDWHGMW